MGSGSNNDLTTLPNSKDESTLSLLPKSPAGTDSVKVHPNSGTVSLFTSIMSCMFYTFTSVSMVLVNKAISYNLSPSVKKRLPDLGVVLYQCLIAIFIVEICKLLKYVDYPSFNLKLAKSWLPVNILFIGMLWSGFISLVYVSVPIATIFKNLANLGTVWGDWFFFKEQITWITIVSVIIMTIGTVLSGLNDLDYNLIGYTWLIINCSLTSVYILYMRYASVNIKLSRFGMLYYNNLISAMILFPICLIRGDFNALRDPEVMTLPFILFNTFAGIIGVSLNFAILWCVSSTSATTFAIVGSFNKVPITILGFILFNAKMTSEGIIFIIMSTLGSFLYAYTKLPSNQSK